MKVGVFYASETGNTKNHAFDIAKQLCDHDLMVGDPEDIADLEMSKLKEFDVMIFGSPTWNIGELQADLEAMVRDFNEVDIIGKKVAVYGCGDQEGYPDTYQDAIGILAEVLINSGATLIGKTSPSGHRFEASKALVEGEFLGLALDNHNQADLTSERISRWVEQLVSEIKNLSNPIY